ncbi:MAG: ATP-binding protein [Pseudomonadota bacterium]
MTAQRPAIRRVLLSWSSGKDSAWCLHVLRQRSDVEVVGLLTTIDEAADRVAMHAVRRELLERQADAVGLALITAELPWPCPNADYERLVGQAIAEARSRFAVDTVAFGDLYLEDIRRYREQQLGRLGVETCYPLWQQPTAMLAQQMVAGGLRAVITCVDPKRCSSVLAGREFDPTLLAELPPSVDPCGENGEFHTFAFDSPDFERPIDVKVGTQTERDGFVFADLTPITTGR